MVILDYKRAERLLETYTIEEILEHNDLDIVEVLVELSYEYGLKLPPEPCN